MAQDELFRDPHEDGNGSATAQMGQQDQEANRKAMVQWLAAAGAVIRAADLGETTVSMQSTPVEVICASLEDAAKQLTAFKQADPLLGAAQWLLKAIDNCDAITLQQRLAIGYNRAQRLLEAAKGHGPKLFEGGPDLLPLGPNDENPALLWAAIWRLRAAVVGPEGYPTWQAAAAAERALRVKAEAQLQATTPQPSVHEPLLNGRYVAVSAGALQLVRNALRTDAEGGKGIRGEILEDLDKATFCLEDGQPADTQAIAAEPSHFKELIDRLERSAHRMGELYNAHQGKGWPEAASNEFDRLRDERMPLLRRALVAMLEQGVDDVPSSMLIRWEQYRREIEDMEERMGSLAANFLRLKAWDDAAKCAIKADGMRFVRGRMPPADAVAKAEMPDAGPDLDVALIQRLMKVSDRLGISTEPGVENFSADLPSRLYAICRAVDSIFDRH